VTRRWRREDDKENKLQEWETEELAYNHKTAIFILEVMNLLILFQA
jgi:hypothetical protein